MRKYLLLTLLVVFGFSPAFADNDYFESSTYHMTAGARARASDVNTALDAIETGLDKLPSETNLKRGLINYAVDAGAANAYVVTLTYVPTEYTDGMEVVFKASAANTGASTINVNSLGVKSITRQDGAALAAGDIGADEIISIRYNSTSAKFEIIGGAKASTGEGTMAAQNADSVAITGGTIESIAISGGTIDGITAETSTGAVVTIDGTQTLTNKRLTSPKLNEDVQLTATATKLNNLASDIVLIADYSNNLSTAATAIGTSTVTTVLADSAIAVAATLDLSTYTNITWKVIGAGQFAPASGQTLTFPSPAHVVAAPTQQIFSGAGTVAFNQGGRASAMWAGALSDGATDDAAAIQEIADSLTAGGTLFFPKGSSYYSISTTIDLDTADNLMVEFEKGAEIRLSAASKDGFNITKDHVTIDGATMEGEGTYVTTGTSGTSLIVSSGDYTTIRNCYLKEPEQKGIEIANGADYAIIENNIIEGGKYFADGTAIGSDRQHFGIYLLGADRAIIRGNKILPNADANPGIAIQGIAAGTSAYPCYDLLIADNYVGSVYNHAMYLQTVEGCTIKGNVCTASIKVGMREHSLATRGNSIVGNNIDINDPTGVLATETGIILVDAKWTSVIGNVIRRTRDAGIGFNSQTGDKVIMYNVIANNVIDNVIDGGGSDAGGIVADITDCTVFAYNSIVGNVINDIGDDTDGVQAGIYIECIDNDNHVMNLIADNVISDSYEFGLYLKSLTQATVRGNVFKTIGQSADGYGIYINDVNYSTFEGNQVFGDGTNLIYGIYGASSDNNVYRNNRFYNIATESIHRAGLGASDKVEQLDDSETLTATATLHHWGTSLLNANGGAFATTLPDGTLPGQIKIIKMSDATAEVTVSVTHHETSDPEVFTFGAVTDILILQWNGLEWVTINNQGVAT